MPETGVHLRVRTALFLLLERQLNGRAFVGSEQFVYWDPTDPKKCLAPDVMVRLGAPSLPLPSFKTWEHGAPHVAVEIISRSDAGDRNWDEKLERYRQCGASEVVRFDPEDDVAPLRLWDLVEGDMVERNLTQPSALACDALGAYWFVASDAALGRTLRVAADPLGAELWPTADELAERERREKDAMQARIAELERRLDERR